MKLISISAAMAALLAATALADFSYQETTKMTGGIMMGHAGNAGAKPQTYITYVKGNRMARIGPEHGQITDLDKETIINLNYADKTYSVLTFAEMKTLMARMGGGHQDAGGVDVSSHETGKTRPLGKTTAKEMILTVKVGNSEIDNDVWLTPMVPGYDEVRQFQQRMAQKMGPASAPGIQRTMQEATKALTKANGVPMLRTSSIRSGTAGGAASSDKPTVEMSTELSALSSAPVDPSKFDIPAGFKKKEVSAAMQPHGQNPHGQAPHQ